MSTTLLNKHFQKTGRAPYGCNGSDYPGPNSVSQSLTLKIVHKNHLVGKGGGKREQLYSKCRFLGSHSDLLS